MKLLVKFFCGSLHKEGLTGQAKAYTKKICDGINCNPSDLPNMMENGIGWQRLQVSVQAVPPDDDLHSVCRSFVSDE